MPLWGNTDSANSKPIFPLEREVVAVARLTVANNITSGNTLYLLSAVPASVQSGTYVYSQIDASGNSVSRFFNGDIIDQNNLAYFKSNNTVSVVVDAANGVVRCANNFCGTITGNTTMIYFANSLNWGTTQYANTVFADTVLVTATRTTAANNQIGGNLNAGWNHIRKKVNSDSTVRYIRECLVAVANGVASNTASGNTSWGQAVANT
jgi:hypothetical protein